MQSSWSTIFQSWRPILTKPQEENYSSWRQEGMCRERRVTRLWGRAGDKEGKPACEGLELVFQVKLLLSQNTEVYLQVRTNGIFFDCLADLENFVSDCFWSRTYRSTNHTASKGHHVQFTWTHSLPLGNSSTLTHFHRITKHQDSFSRRLWDTASLYSLYWPWNHNSPASVFYMLGLQACVS